MDLLRRYVLHDFALKLMAVALAVLLWLAVGRTPAEPVNPAAAPAANSR
ncbi:MAG: hypothetical protein L0212_03775 [Acidobacteria bacterium]|nr:hypothetical protein [Acidobacteriota bacterium]